MIRKYMSLALILSACGHFPQVDAVAPQDVPARPEFLPPSTVAALNAAAADIAPPAPLPEDAEIRARADDLRAR